MTPDIGLCLVQLAVSVAIAFYVGYRLGRAHGYTVRGYWICDDDWQGESLDECHYVDEQRPIPGMAVYYRSGGALKPWGRR